MDILFALDALSPNAILGLPSLMTALSRTENASTWAAIEDTPHGEEESPASNAKTSG